jgi:hypothetical protein
MFSYKKPVIDELLKYAKEITGARGIITESNRFKMASTLLDYSKKYDPIFLIKTISETYTISDEKSNLRDKVGKAAGIQLFHFFVDSVETLQVISLAAALQSGEYMEGGLVFLSLGLTELFAEQMLKNLQQFGLKSGLDKTFGSIKSLTPQSIYQSLPTIPLGKMAINISSNVCHFFGRNAKCLFDVVTDNDNERKNIQQNIKNQLRL